MARKPGRPPKHRGLRPVEDTPNGDTLQDVRSETGRLQEPVLSEARKAVAAEDGGRRLFATVGSEGGSDGSGEVKATRRRDTEFADKLTEILRRLMTETAAPEIQDMESMTSGGLTNAEALARVMLHMALVQRDKAMIQLVVDRVEGKAVQAAPVREVDNSIEEQLDRLSIDKLNDLVPGKA